MADQSFTNRNYDDQAVFVGEEVDASVSRPFRIRPNERSGHMLVVGADGRGKQSLMWNLMVQDIQKGAGVCVIDVTGNYAHALLDAIPASRTNETLYFHPGNQRRVVAFNPFFGIKEAERSRAAQSFMALFVAIWKLTDDSHPLMLRLMRASSRALLDSQEGTLLGMYALLTNANYRQRVVSECHDPMARRFWVDFETWDEKDKRDKPQPVLTRLEAFLSDPHLRCVLGQAKSTLDLDRVVAQRQVLVADLPRYELGAETARLFGSLLLTRMQNILEARPGGWPFYIYVPDVHHVHVALAARAITSQFKNAGVVTSVDQLASYDRDHQNGLLNAKRLVAFRLAPDDARKVAARFPIPKSEKSLMTLAENRLALSDWKHELNAVDMIPAKFGGRKHVLRRSENILGVPRKPVERKISAFLDGLSEGT
ncbi:MAG: hypothetical protein AAGK03_03785 [Pseudomonadota bacterium]